MSLRVFSEGPYYDDFDESKGFHRILFKPGTAVQARELTQLQTILQKQIERHGSSIYDDGSMVLGGKTSSDFSLHFLRISSTLLNSAVIADLVGKMLIGVTSTATAKVVTYTQEADRANTYTLLVKTFSDIPFTSGETLQYQPDPNISGTNLATLISTTYDYQGHASVFSIQQGVFYTRGNFVFCPAQTIPIAFDKYDGGGSVTFDASKPNARLGLQIVEGIIDSDSDSSLLDPALGSYNYNAPGADRYSISLDLISKSLLKQARATVGVDSGTTGLTTFTITNGGAGYPSVNFNTVPISITDPVGTGGTAIISSVDADTGAITSIVRTAAGSGYAQSTVGVTIAVPTETDDTFIELARYENGVLTKDVTHPVYSVIGDTMARRTSDESGDYALNPFLIRLSDSDLGSSYFTANIEAGKAYVKGYEINKISSTPLDVLRARDTDHQKSVANYNINSYYGNYVVVAGDTVTKPFDPTGFPLVNLLQTSVVIGTARLAQITLHSVGTPDKFRFHLSEVNITNPAKNFTLVDEIQLAADATTSAPVLLADRLLVEPSASALMHVLPNQNTKTINGVLSYSYWVTKTGTTDGAGGLTLTQSGGVQFKPVASSSVSDMMGAYIVYNTTTSGIIDLTGVSITASGVNPSTAVFTGLPITTNVTVLALVEATGIGMKAKTLNNGSGTGTYNEVYTVLAADITNGYITLGKWDGFKLLSVTVGADDITSRFTFDTGQRDASYQYSRLVLNPGEVMPVAGSSLTITYDYLFHAATGDFFCVDSYPTYDDIPTYVAKDGTTLPLENVLDFRPNADTSNPPVMPFIGTDIVVGYTYYVGRIDRVVLNRHGNFLSVEGVPSLTPQAPKGGKNSMSIAFLTITPYTKNPKTDVRVTPIDNRRYTMRDIGVLDQRIGHLEYYNTLNLLEKNVKELLVLDGTGLDRFKNGSLVDAFAGFSIADVNNPDLACGIDMAENFMTCRGVVETHITRPLYDTRTNVAIANQFVTLDYSVVPAITQGAASASISVNPFNVTAFEGKMLTQPPSDFWKETTKAPDVIINKTGENDGWAAGLDSSYTYGEWSSNYDGRYGADRLTTEADINAHITNNGLGPWLNADGTQVTLNRTVTKVSPVFLYSTHKVGEQVVNTSVIPLMRTIDVVWAATGMKPNTRVYPFFDNKDILIDVARADVLKIAVLGGLAIPTITAFDYDEMPHVAQMTTSFGAAHGRVVMCRNGWMHVVRDPRSPSFEVNGNPLELKWNRKTASGVVDTYNTTFTVSLVSLSCREWIPSDGAAVTFNLQHAVNSPHTVADLVVIKNGVVLANITDFTITGSTITFVTAPKATDKAYVFFPWTLRTDPSGCLSGVYTVPANTFHTGDRLLRFIDDSADVVANATTLSDYVFSSKGLKETVQDTYVTTRTFAGTKSETWTESYPVWADPLAESFLVDSKIYPNGLFLDSVDLCFHSKDPALPVQIEIRPMVNGYPHSSTYLPGSVVEKDTDSVNVTAGFALDPLPGVGFLLDDELVPSFSDPRTVTNFKFSAPLFLKPGEYAVVIKSNSDLYEVFYAKIGAKQLGSNATITSQPYTGSMFLSQNASTWTADQTSDIMFQLNRCEFVSSGAVNVVPTNFTDSTPFDYDILWATANNIEFDGIANVVYGIKTTDPTTLALDAAYTPFVVKDNVYFTSRRRLTSDSTLVPAVTAQTTYTLPYLNVSTDHIDLLLLDTTDATVENIQNKGLYIVRDKVAAPAGTKELVFQSAIKPVPDTGANLRFIRASSAVVELALATTDTKVSPVVDLTQFALRFIQNQINAGGVTAATFKLPDISGSFPHNSLLDTPDITLATGSAGSLRCVTYGGMLTDVIIDAAGTGYSSGSATVSAPGGGGVNATVLLTVNGGGGITGVTITNPGSGYKQTTLTLTTTTGSSASVYPIVTQQTAGNASSGQVTGWHVAAEGHAYVDNFTATLNLSYSGGSSGTYTVTVTNECSAKGGNALARYISRRVTLADGFDAKDIKVYLTAMKPQNGSVDVYYKVLAADDNTNWSDRPWVRMTKVADVQSLNFGDYKEMEFSSTGSTAYSGFSSYKIFAVKVVLTTLSEAYSPRIHDLRGLALATTY